MLAVASGTRRNGAAKCGCNSISFAPAAGSRLAASLAGGPAGHPSRAQIPRRGAEGDRATGRHWLRSRKDLSYAWRLRRIRGDLPDGDQQRFEESPACGT